MCEYEGEEEGGRGGGWRDGGSGEGEKREGAIGIFFFKQETAYEVRLSLVGSEMFIRNSWRRDLKTGPERKNGTPTAPSLSRPRAPRVPLSLIHT